MTQDEEMLAWKVMDLWGSEDSRFSRKEIALIVGLSEKEVQRIIDLVKKERPEVYQKRAEAREKLDKQNKFEQKMGKMDSLMLDQDFDTNYMDYETPPSTNNKDYIVKRKLRKNKDDFGHDGEDEE